jgi:hypothetical protein
MRRLVTGVCSFCKEMKPVIATENDSICNECVYRATVKTKEWSPGILVCRCDNWEAFTLVSNTNVSVTFKSMDTDASGGVIYYPLLASSKLTKDKLVLKKIVCTMCKRDQPNWLLDHNKYIAAHFKHK